MLKNAVLVKELTLIHKPHPILLSVSHINSVQQTNGIK